MNLLWRSMLTAALALSIGASGAQPAYPGKPIRLVVPAPAGGPSDAAARALAKGMTVRADRILTTRAD